MTAISRSAVKLWLVAAGTAPSALSTNVWSTSNTSGYIPGVIKEYSVTGGEADVESDPLFGGFVDKEKPRSQFEIELTIVPALEASTFDFHAISLAADTGTTTVYTTRDVGSDRMFAIQGNTGSSYKSWAFNNCSITTHDMSHSADDNQEQTLTLKFSPTDSGGIPNYQFSKVVVTSLLVWSGLAL